MLNGLLNIGQTALNAAQAWISVTGSNIANADTEGYTRRYVDQRDAGTIKTRPGGEGVGVNAQQVLRYFDAFLERSFVGQSTNSARWDKQKSIMASVENVFNESNRAGVNSALNAFFRAWQDLTKRPDDTASRESLLSHADNLADLLGNSVDRLKAIQREMDVSIEHAVERVNALSKGIADINRQINAHTVEEVSNPNHLLDKRDLMVREMATLVGVETVDNGHGNFVVKLTTGQPLVQGLHTFDLQVMPPRSERRLMNGSTFAGHAVFDGADSHEYTVEIVKGGTAGAMGAAGNPVFRVSLDAGRTWLRDEDGAELRFEVSDEDGDGTTDPVQVKKLKIHFDSAANFAVGDTFDIIPKNGLAWVEPTRGPQNITPQIFFDGSDNRDRVVGGELASFFNIRDDNCGRYLDELDAFAAALIWEVNRIHSQGTGNIMPGYVQGQQSVGRTDVALGSPQAILPQAHRLQAGNLNLHFFSSVTGEHVISGQLDFDAGTAGIQNFDPAVHTLEDVVAAINSSFPDPANPGQNLLQAEIQHGKLLVRTNPVSNVRFGMGVDSTGLLAALGLNTFFSGSDADSLAVNAQLHGDVNLVAAGQVNGQFQANAGDNITAIGIGQLADATVPISTVWKTVKNQTLSQYFATLVTTVGADTRLAGTNAEYHAALTANLDDQVNSVSGVNLDEEMAKLVRHQHSYTAAAKLITTADQMLQTLLGLKQ